MLIPYQRLLCPDGSAAQQQVLQNLVRTISDKYFLLARRVDLLLLRTLRAKVSSYLLSEARTGGAAHLPDPLHPGPAGQLSQLRPQCPQPGAGPDAAGGPAGHLPQQL